MVPTPSPAWSISSSTKAFHRREVPEANAGISAYGTKMGPAYKVNLAAGTGPAMGWPRAISKPPSVISTPGDGVLAVCPAHKCCRNGLSSYTDTGGNTAANPVTNILHGGQTGRSTFQRPYYQRQNCSVNGYEFGQPGIPTLPIWALSPQGQTAIAIGGDGASVKSEIDLRRHPQCLGLRPLQL